MKLAEIVLLEAAYQERWVDEAELKQLQAKYFFTTTIDAGRGVVTMLTDIPAKLSDAQARALIGRVTGQADDSWLDKEPEPPRGYNWALPNVMYEYLTSPDVRTSDKAIAYLHQYSPHDERHGFYRIKITTFAGWVQNTKEDWQSQMEPDDFTDDE